MIKVKPVFEDPLGRSQGLGVDMNTCKLQRNS